MILSVHFITGAAITKLIPNKLIAYPLAFLSHFLLDAIPHADYSLKGISSGWKKKSFYSAVGNLTLDVLAGVVFTVVFSMAFDNFDIQKALIGGFLGILPDFLNLLSYLFHNKNFLFFIRGGELRPIDEFKIQTQNRYYRFHHCVHNKSEPKGLFGVFTQAIIFLIGIIVLVI